MAENGGKFGITPRVAMELWMASLAGDAELAVELERLGLSDEADSLDDAQGLSAAILEAVEAARRAG